MVICLGRSVVSSGTRHKIVPSTWLPKSLLQTPSFPAHSVHTILTLWLLPLTQQTGKKEWCGNSVFLDMEHMPKCIILRSLVVKKTDFFFFSDFIIYLEIKSLAIEIIFLHFFLVFMNSINLILMRTVKWRVSWSHNSPHNRRFRTIPLPTDNDKSKDQASSWKCEEFCIAWISKPTILVFIEKVLEISEANTHFVCFYFQFGRGKKSVIFQ